MMNVIKFNRPNAQTEAERDKVLGDLKDGRSFVVVFLDENREYSYYPYMMRSHEIVFGAEYLKASIFRGLFEDEE